MPTAPIVTIFGGSGFLGRYITQRFAKAGWRIRVAVRRPNEAHFVRPYGVVGQVEPIQANIRDEASTRRAIEGASVVINAVAIAFEDPKSRVIEVQDEGAERIARLSAELGVEKLVHVSAIGADAESDSHYASTKAEGEAAVLEHFSSATILRPSVIFGNEDMFYNRFANMARFFPILPLVGANTKFQPVYVDDVAAAALAAVESGKSGIYELGGPEVQTFRETMEDMLKVTRRRRLILNLPRPIAYVMASVLDFGQFITFGLLPNKMITRDQIRTLAVDNVVSESAMGFEELGITPRSSEGILETYLYCYRPYGQFTELTESAEGLRDQ